MVHSPIFRVSAFLVFCIRTGLALDLYVSPEGQDNWSGHVSAASPDKTDGPLRTLTGARDAIRRLQPDERNAGPINVRIAGGVYRVSEPLLLEPRDSGSPERPITYQAEPGAKPVISAGREISGFKATDDGLWTVDLPDVAGGKWYFEELWINGRRATRARTPNQRWFQAAGPAKGPVNGVTPVPPLEETAILAHPDDLKTLQGVGPEEVRDVNVIVYHSWQTSRHRLAGFDPETGGLQFTGPGRWTFFKMNPSHRIHFENYRAALDAPGEWFLSRKGTLFYMPRSGEKLAEVQAVAPARDQWLILKGDPEQNAWVQHVRFRGLGFHHTGFTLPAGGWSSSQADVELQAGVEADGVRGVLFDNCEFAQTGGYAVWLRHGCSDVVLQKCHLHDLGGGGVKIGETAVPKSAAGATLHVRVENCIIHGGGRYFPGAIGVWIGQSGDNAIIHNDIADFYYTAISTGWMWGFTENPCVRNRIEWNHLHHLGWGVLSDMGAVYTLGPSAGSVVRHNRVHDITCYAYGGWGLYNDEGSTGFLLENNLVYRAQSGGYHQHYGRENVIRNNIFAFADDMQIRHSRAEDHLAFTFERNIVLWSKGKLFGSSDEAWRGSQVQLSKNLYWKTDGQPFDFAGKDFAGWQAEGYDIGSVIADPMFVSAETGNFELKPESPAQKIGFQPFDYSSAGVTGDEAWRQLAAEEITNP